VRRMHPTVLVFLGSAIVALLGGIAAYALLDVCRNPETRSVCESSAHAPFGGAR
jgi:hypothetical protein